MTEIQPTHSLLRSPIIGFSALLVGPTGSGKTKAMESLVSEGIVPFALFTEPSTSIVSHIPCPKLHWHYVKPIAQSFSDMIQSATDINELSFDLLTKKTDPNRRKHRQFIEVLQNLHNFKCDRCGQEFGDMPSWGTNRALYFDSLSGTNPMAMSLVTGDKPVKSQADWQVAQNTLLNLIQKLCTDRRCHFIMTSHMEREIDEISGGIHLTVSTLGRKLAPQIPRFFDEVINTIREGKTFRWSNMTINVDLKARLLPLDDKLQPGFHQLVEAWKNKGGIIE